MTGLQLPPAPPLPDDVRERVLRTVLAEACAPRRRVAPLVAAVVAVVATLALTTSVALTGAGGPAAQQEGPAGTVQDRPIPEPAPASPQDEDGEQRTALERCLVSTLASLAGRTHQPHTIVLPRDADASTPRALVARMGGRAAVCYLDPGGPVAAAGELAAAPETRIVTSLRRDGLVVALVQVTSGVERVEIATSPQPGSVGRGTTCTVGDGLALCMLRADGAVDVRAFSGSVGAVLPVP